MQHGLWAVFDWAARGDGLPEQRLELETRLAEAVRRVALTPEQIRTLPDTYTAAVASQQFAAAYDLRNPQQSFLPPELFRSGGPWVCLSAYSEQPTARGHFSGRSRFLIFLRLPGGRDATLAYIRKLRSSSEPAMILSESGRPLLNLALPQIPVGTQVALVRQAIVIDTEGKLAATALTESVQLRVYHAITPGTPYMNYFGDPSRHDQDFFEFRMSLPSLFAHRNGGLVPVHPGETEYPTFSTHGTDAFESATPLDGQTVILERCRGCHGASGIHSVQSRVLWMNRSEDIRERGSDESESEAVTWETSRTIARKERQSEFNLLQELWHSGPD